VPSNIPNRVKNEVAVNLTAIIHISGKSMPYLRRLESILTLPNEVIEAVKNGTLNKAQAQVFVRR